MTQCVEAIEEEQRYLSIEELEDIEPLDLQMGADPKLTVPEVLQEAMFGEPEASAQERSHYGEAVPPMGTYAVLDAGKMPYLLTASLQGSGLEYASLFQGEAQEELKERAPYLVRLEEGNDFTRKLFTQLNPPLGLWDKELGIYLRSRASFMQLRKHLRKFTRIQDQNRKWFLFRFWDSRASFEIFRMIRENKDDVFNFFYSENVILISTLLAITTKKISLIKPALIDDGEVKPFVFTKEKQDILNKNYGHRFEQEFAQKLFDTTIGNRNWLGIDTVAPIESMTHVIANSLKSAGFTRRDEIAKIAVLAYFNGTYFMIDPRVNSLVQSSLLKKGKSPIFRIKQFQTEFEEKGLGRVLLSDEALAKITSKLTDIMQGCSATFDEFIDNNPTLLPHNYRASFIEHCRKQCEKWKIFSANTFLIHQYTALVFTPLFMEDPLHLYLRNIFMEQDEKEIIQSLLIEFKRKLSITQ